MNIRFPGYPNLELSDREQALLDTADARLLAAQQQLAPDLPRETPGWLDMLLAGTVEVSLGVDEVRALSRVVDACLHVLPVDDRHLSALAGLHRLDGMAFLRSAYSKWVQISWGNGNLIGSEKLAAVDRSSAIAGG